MLSQKSFSKKNELFKKKVFILFQEIVGTVGKRSPQKKKKKKKKRKKKKKKIFGRMKNQEGLVLLVQFGYQFLPTKKKRKRFEKGCDEKLLKKEERKKKKLDTSRLCVSSLRRGHANLLCIVPILTDGSKRTKKLEFGPAIHHDSSSD